MKEEKTKSKKEDLLPTDNKVETEWFLEDAETVRSKEIVPPPRDGLFVVGSAGIIGIGIIVILFSIFSSDKNAGRYSNTSNIAMNMYEQGDIAKENRATLFQVRGFELDPILVTSTTNLINLPPLPKVEDVVKVVEEDKAKSNDKNEIKKEAKITRKEIIKSKTQSTAKPKIAYHQDKESMLKRFLKDGQIAYQKGDYKKAIAFYKKAQNLDPSNKLVEKLIERAKEKIR